MATATQSRRDCRTEPTRDLDSKHFSYAQHWDPGFVKAIGDELDRLSQLAQNWDHEGAPPIDREIIEAARRFVTALPENLA